MSAAWEQLAAAVLAMIQGDASNTLTLLPPDTQGALVSLVLTPTRCIGSEAASFVAAEDMSGADIKNAMLVSSI